MCPGQLWRADRAQGGILIDPGYDGNRWRGLKTGKLFKITAQAALRESAVQTGGLCSKGGGRAVAAIQARDDGGRSQAAGSRGGEGAWVPPCSEG